VTVSTSSTSGGPWSLRRVSWIVLAIGGIGSVVVASLLVPWHPVPWQVGPQVAPGDVFTPEQIARAEDFAGPARALSLSSLGLSLVVVSVLGFTPLGRRLMHRIRGPWPVAVVLGVLGMLLLGRLVTLPVALVLRDHIHDYGLSHQALSGWFVDQATSLGVQTVMSSLVLIVLIGCARRWPRAWPGIAGAGLAALVMAGSFVYPVLVEPLFNNFESLPDGSLRTAIMHLADREGVHVDDVLVADASRRTTTLNAYVSGFGNTRRVVLYDNLVNDTPQDQTLSVVAHELGHAKHDDVLIGSVLGASGAVAAVGLLGLVAGGGWLRRGQGLASAGAVPLVLALSAWGSLLGSPVENAISRQIETRADVTALESTHDPSAFVGVQKQLAVRGLSDPTPPALLQFWFGSHPTTLTRIGIAEWGN
jgi:STE24 endopeptidase